MRFHLPALLLVAAAACAPRPPQGLRIAASTQARVDGDLLIGVGNCRREGARPSCGVWISGAAAATYYYRVLAGQTVHAAARKIEVLDVNDGAVVVAVSR